MEKLKTATGREFACDYFNYFSPAEQVNLRLLNTTLVEAASVFSNPAETIQLFYEKEYLAYHTRLIAIIPEGDAIRVVLGKE